MIIYNPTSGMIIQLFKNTMHFLYDNFERELGSRLFLRLLIIGDPIPTIDGLCYLVWT